MRRCFSSINLLIIGGLVLTKMMRVDTKKDNALSAGTLGMVPVVRYEYYADHLLGTVQLGYAMILLC
jgi:hypothetical protein